MDMDLSDKKKGLQLKDLELILGYQFKDPHLIRLALKHPSVVGGVNDSNQRLEFLGDRVLGLFVSECLFLKFRHESEGALAKRFSSLVKRDALARVAQNLGIGPFIEMAPSELASGGRSNPKNLADALEAIIAALHLDGGSDVSRDFVIRHWGPLSEEHIQPPSDSKTVLQEWSQKQGLGLPVYSIVSRSGPPHQPIFEVEVKVSGVNSVRGSGTSKQNAEQFAAKNMLENIECDN